MSINYYECTIFWSASVLLNNDGIWRILRTFVSVQAKNLTFLRPNPLYGLHHSRDVYVQFVENILYLFYIFHRICHTKKTQSIYVNYSWIVKNATSHSVSQSFNLEAKKNVYNV